MHTIRMRLWIYNIHEIEQLLYALVGVSVCFVVVIFFPTWISATAISNACFASILQFDMRNKSDTLWSPRTTLEFFFYIHHPIHRQLWLRYCGRRYYLFYCFTVLTLMPNNIFTQISHFICSHGFVYSWMPYLSFFLSKK